MLVPGEVVNPRVVRHFCIAATGQLRVSKDRLEHPILGGGIGVYHLEELASSSGQDLKAVGIAGYRSRETNAFCGRPDAGGLAKAPIGCTLPPSRYMNQNDVEYQPTRFTFTQAPIQHLSQEYRALRESDYLDCTLISVLS